MIMILFTRLYNLQYSDYSCSHQTGRRIERTNQDSLGIMLFIWKDFYVCSPARSSERALAIQGWIFQYQRHIAHTLEMIHWVPQSSLWYTSKFSILPSISEWDGTIRIISTIQFNNKTLWPSDMIWQTSGLNGMGWATPLARAKFQKSREWLYLNSD